MAGITTRTARDAETQQPFAVQFVDPSEASDGSEGLIQDVPMQDGWNVEVGASAVAPGRRFVVNCTQPGNVIVAFPSGFQLTIPLLVGYKEFEYGIVQIIEDGTTAVATYSNLV